MDAEARIRALEEQVEALSKRLELMEGLVLGRNKSAPTKRNMTDADARRVICGDVASLPHKEAAERVGLTYSQVYSARLGFVFKHVHKALWEEGVRNEWTEKYHGRR